MRPEVIPEGAVFKGYRDVIIQDIVFERHDICYRLAQYKTVDGSTLSGQLPQELNGSHIGKKLHSFILYQYHHQHVTQPLPLQQLRDVGIDISSGGLSQLICQNVELFHDEKQALLPAGLLASQYIHVDDTGARHQGKNGVCTHIGNEHFAWFASTASKSRLNFLSLLGTGSDISTVINAGALAYMKQQRLPAFLWEQLHDPSLVFDSTVTLESWLDTQHITATPPSKNNPRRGVNGWAVSTRNSY